MDVAVGGTTMYGLYMSRSEHLSPKEAKVIRLFVNRPDLPWWGFKIMQETGLKSGSLYPVLDRFVRWGWIERIDGQSTSGGPPRRYYRIRPDGHQEAVEALVAFSQLADDYRTVVPRPLGFEP